MYHGSGTGNKTLCGKTFGPEKETAELHHTVLPPLDKEFTQKSRKLRSLRSPLVSHICLFFARGCFSFPVKNFFKPQFMHIVMHKTDEIQKIRVIFILSPTKNPVKSRLRRVSNKRMFEKFHRTFVWVGDKIFCQKNAFKPLWLLGFLDFHKKILSPKKNKCSGVRGQNETPINPVVEPFLRFFALFCPRPRLPILL